MTLLSNDFLKQYEDKTPPWGFSGLGFIVFKRTYARLVEHEYIDPVTGQSREVTRSEEWHETLRRCIDGAQEIGAGYTREEAERLFDYMFNLKCSFAGR